MAAFSIEHDQCSDPSTAVVSVFVGTKKSDFFSLANHSFSHFVHVLDVLTRTYFFFHRFRFSHLLGFTTTYYERNQEREEKK
jgi:hypothetical protein